MFGYKGWVGPSLLFGWRNSQGRDGCQSDTVSNSNPWALLVILLFFYFFIRDSSSSSLLRSHRSIPTAPSPALMSPRLWLAPTAPPAAAPHQATNRPCCGSPRPRFPQPRLAPAATPRHRSILAPALAPTATRSLPHRRPRLVLAAPLAPCHAAGRGSSLPPCAAPPPSHGHHAFSSPAPLLSRAEPLLRRLCSPRRRVLLQNRPRRRRSFPVPRVRPATPLTPFEWVGVVRSIWRYYSNPHIRGIFSSRVDSYPVNFEPNTSPTGSNPTQPSWTLQPNTP